MVGPRAMGGIVMGEVEERYISSYSACSSGRFIYYEYLPGSFDRNKAYPALLICHGLGLTHRSVREYAQPISDLGCIVYCFDATNASKKGNNGSNTKLLSVKTYCDDIHMLLDVIKRVDYVDEENVFLMGQSLGGAAVALSAAVELNQPKGVILMFPALCICDEAKDEYDAFGEFPENGLKFGLIHVGKRFFQDAMESDFACAMKSYGGPVLILHGDRDNRVPLYYSLWASRLYKNAELVVVKDSGHRFLAEAYHYALGKTKGFLCRHFGLMADME